MKTISVASAKGGSCKTTTVLTLAWRAAQDFDRVAMIDLNADQGTLTQWWTLRGRKVNPYLLKDAGDLEEDIKLLASEHYDVCFIDTPPLDMETIEVSVVMADAVIIPVMASYFDTSAIDSVVDMCKRRKKPYAFLRSAHDKRKIFDEVNREAEADLKGRGKILANKISYDPKYRLAQIEGRAGPEKDDKLKAEVDKVWAEVRELAGLKAAEIVQIKEGRRGM
jgi:chromosome partitioning protein